MNKRTAHERKVADWFLAKKAVVGIAVREMAIAVPTRAKKGPGEVVLQEVALYVVSVLVKAGEVYSDSSGVASTPDEHAQVLGAPEGSYSDAVFAAMKRYPI